MASSRSGLFCAAFFYCSTVKSGTEHSSNNKIVQKVRDLFRFQKEQFLVVYRKKDERSGGHQAYLNWIKSTIPDLNASPYHQ